MQCVISTPTSPGVPVLITGGRVKIGFQTVLRLLRDGAKVLVTTRFPHAAALRFQAEDDSSEWSDRLQLYGLDLRNIPAVEAFSQHLLQTESSLDIIIHNAAQTIRRPSGFYQDLIAQEQAPRETLSIEAMRACAAGCAFYSGDIRQFHIAAACNCRFQRHPACRLLARQRGACRYANNEQLAAAT